MGIKYYKVYKNNREAKRTKYRTIEDPDFKHYRDWDHYCHCVWCSEKY